MSSPPPDPSDASREADTGLDPELGQLAVRLDRLWPRSSESSLYSMVGRRLDQFVIDRPLGVGAFGVVYKAWDEVGKCDVALKVPRPEIVASAEKLQRFIREATAVARLQHPGIVPLLAAQLHSEIPYIAVGYCDGTDLDQWLQTHPLPEPEVAVDFICRIADAVQHAHERGIIHRDLKPSNVLLRPAFAAITGTDESLSQYEPLLTDFGLARLLQEQIEDTRSSLVIGTPLYMAPEQAAGHRDQIGPASDIFGLGALMYHLLTGSPPFAADSYPGVLKRLETGDVREPRSVRPDVPADLNTICMKCLAIDPGERYESMAMLIADLNSFRKGRKIVARPANLWRRFRRWLRRDERVQEACSVVQAILVTRFTFGVLGLLLLMASAEASVTSAETTDAAFSHLAIILPFESFVYWQSQKARRGRLTRTGYWVVLLLMLMLLSVNTLATFGVFVPSLFYQREPSARIIAFSMIWTMFVAQILAWMVAGRRAATGRGTFAQHAMAFVCVAAVTGGLVVNHWRPDRTDMIMLTGPDLFTHFNGEDDFIATSDVPFVEDTPFTVELWFRPNDARRSCLLTYGPVSLMTTSAADGVHPRVQLLQDDGSVFLIDIGTNCLLNEWHHFAATYDRDKLSVYIDGMMQPSRLFQYVDDQLGLVAAASLPRPLVLPDVYPGSATYIGANQPPDGPNPYPFSGDIGEVRIMDSVFYRGPFVPQASLSQSSTTRALLHLTSEGQ